MFKRLEPVVLNILETGVAYTVEMVSLSNPDMVYFVSLIFTLTFSPAGWPQCGRVKRNIYVADNARLSIPQYYSVLWSLKLSNMWCSAMRRLSGEPGKQPHFLCVTENVCKTWPLRISCLHVLNFAMCKTCTAVHALFLAPLVGSYSPPIVAIAQQSCPVIWDIDSSTVNPPPLPVWGGN